MTDDNGTMSLDKKLKAAALEAATEATARERGRCLWILDKIVADAEKGAAKKLMTEAQLHAAQTKLKIAQAIVMEARRGIMSGLRPEEKTT